MTNSLTRRNALALFAAAPMTLAARGARAATQNVSIQGFAFSPASISVSAGDTIVFTNNDGAPHTATATNGAFDTGRLNGGDHGSITIDSAGSYEFFCKFHPKMKGTVTAA